VNRALNGLGDRDIKIAEFSIDSAHVFDSDKELNNGNGALNELRKRNNCIPVSTMDCSQGMKGQNLFSPRVFEGEVGSKEAIISLDDNNRLPHRKKLPIESLRLESSI
jgi:hypothetical protein